MSEWKKIDPQDLTKSLESRWKDSLDFSRLCFKPLMYILVSLNLGGSRCSLGILLSQGLVLLVVEKAQGNGRVHGKEGFFLFGRQLGSKQKRPKGEMHQGHYNCHLAVTNMYSWKKLLTQFCCFLPNSKGKLAMF